MIDSVVYDICDDTIDIDVLLCSVEKSCQSSVCINCYGNKPGTGMKSKITSAVKTIVEQQMQQDDDAREIENSNRCIRNRLNGIRNRSSGRFYLVYTFFVLSSNGAFFSSFCRDET